VLRTVTADIGFLPNNRLNSGSVGGRLPRMAEMLRVEENDVQELFFERGWTDGLPVVAPTPERVAAMLRTAGMPADAQLSGIAQRGRSVSAPAS
jgi:hypothetical protein